jgi:hypothetical protein
MKVKHPVPSPQEPQRQSSMGDHKLEDTDLKVNDPAVLEAMSNEIPQPHEEADLHLLPHKEKELDTDLAFERDELLQRDSHMTPQHWSPKVWQVKGMNLKLSALEATVVVKKGIFTYDDFSL